MAAPVLLATGLGDLYNTTLRNLGKPNFTEIATDLQEHTAMKNLLRKNRVELQSGTGVQWTVKVAQTGAARNVGLAASDIVEIVDTMVQAQADWRNSTTNYAIIGQEEAMNREPSRIVDLVLSRRIDMLISMAELMENNFWGPPVAVDDLVTPWGVNTWLVKSATEGFTGAAPSGYTTIGLNPTTYPRWKNYAGPYTSLTRDDFIRRARKAARFTNWKPPVDGIPTFNTGNVYGFYTNNAVLSALEETLESQNENLGTDIASQDDRAVFRRAKVEWVPRLESDTTNPFYGINWGDFKTIILKGWWLKETFVPMMPGQHTVRGVFQDCTYNWVMKNRRTSFVLSTGVTYPS